MQHILSNLDLLREQLRNEHLFLFLDYDGTLVEIAEKPELAKFPQHCRDLLLCLSQYKRCQLAFVSGRQVDNLRDVIGLENAVYAGSHGYDIIGPGLEYRHAVPPGYGLILADIKFNLISYLEAIKNAYIEDKGTCLSVHYRLCSESDANKLKECFTNVVSAYTLQNRIRVSKGKKLLEIMPAADWGKGNAVHWILKNRPAATFSGMPLPIYIGDDYTDESAFEKLQNVGITIYVGAARESKAHFYVKNVQEVYKFFKYIHACLQCSATKATPNIRLYGKTRCL